MKKKPIFIHALFRTGSTYIWNKFRQNGAYRCYYEPFHQELALLESGNTERWESHAAGADSIGHPLLDREYMDEYRQLLKPGRKGVPFFEKSFSFDDFCRSDPHPAQKKYVDFLMENCGGRIPLLQFNRSSLRSQWFKRHFPDVLHVYLVRSPRQQFSSCLRLAETKGLDIFLVMDLLAVSHNRKNCAAFRELARRIPLVLFQDPEFKREEAFYRFLLGLYSRADKYLIHYCIWLAALLENLEHADMMLNIDLLSGSEAYRRKVGGVLSASGFGGIDFTDARIRDYPDPFLEEPECSRVEELSWHLAAGRRRRAGIERLLSRLDREERASLRLDLEPWRVRRRTRVMPWQAATMAVRAARLSRQARRRFVAVERQDGGPARPAAEMRRRGGTRLAGRSRQSLPGRPLVTVVTVAFNETWALERTLQSVRGQSYDNIELIVIDGGSGEPTLDIIRRYADRIDYWQSEPDLGIFDAMNKGISLAGGEWINFLNCGDRFFGDDTVQTVFARDYADADFVYGHTDFQGGDFRGVVKAWSFDILWKTMVFTHQSLFGRASVLKMRPFDIRYRICADFDLIFNAYRQGRRFVLSDTVIASFAPGFSDVSRSRMAWEKWRVVKAHRNDPAFHWFYLRLFIRRLYRDIRRRYSADRQRR